VAMIAADPLWRLNRYLGERIRSCQGGQLLEERFSRSAACEHMRDLMYINFEYTCYTRLYGDPTSSVHCGRAAAPLSHARLRLLPYCANDEPSNLLKGMWKWRCFGPDAMLTVLASDGHGPTLC
jgi:hypothetical protein